MDGTKGPRTIAITSGKGGVGKTNLAVNLCLALAEQGAKTCLLDADLGLANVNVLMGLEVGATLEDVVFGRVALDDIILRDRHGIDIIPGSSGVERMADLGGRELESLLESFSRLGEYDFFLMDTSAGISKNVTAFCLGASEVILVLLPEPASMTDAYALLKVLDRNGFKGVVKVVVSQCKTVSAARKCYALLKETADRFLGARLALAGVIIHDQKVPAAIAKRVPVIKSYPGSNASRCIRHLAKTLLGQGAARAGDGGLPGFWTRFLGILKAPLELGGVEEENETQGPVPDEGSAPSPGPDYARLLSVLESLTRELASVGGELRQTREAMESLFASGMKLQQAAE
ncbi:MAG: MinD/ParA family protein, partial [Desulfobacteraceae bacterium]